MNALLQLITHEYRKYVFTRGFLAFIMIIPLAGAFGAFANKISDKASPIRHFVVLDETGEFIPRIDDALADRDAEDTLGVWDQYAYQWVSPNEDGTFPLEPPFAPGDPSPDRASQFYEAGGTDAALAAAKPYLKDGAPEVPSVRARYVRVGLPMDVPAAGDQQSQIEQLLPYLNGKKMLADDRALFAVVVIPADIREGRQVGFWTNNLIASDLSGFIGRALGETLRNEAFTAEGLDVTVVDRIRQIQVSVNEIKADQAGGEDGAAARVRTVIPLVLAYTLFIMITSVGGMLLTNTVEEKSNKIVEMLLSSVSATQLMIGKLVGLALVGITMPALFLGIGYLLLTFFGADAAPGTAAEIIGAIKGGLFGSPLVPLFFLYFVLGYLFYSSIYLAVGAMSDSIQDAQSFVVPLTLMLLLPLPFLSLVIQDPNGIVARVLTFIPLYTPYAVMLRISAQPPFWEIAAATALLLFVVGYVVFTMGRIYRKGVLSSSGAPSWKEFLNLVRR
ncbi:ABC transporter permease [Parvularcula marina]|uniref:ABC transporter permease n=1 Tax=Parvularcula marina TaxID=2292771 RepID=A0A371RF42_9PROT|nr:ABC transporter permease [Parvularcula marina]RFB04055.1 ABC transporter permease [Parvularcula marina]